MYNIHFVVLLFFDSYDEHTPTTNALHALHNEMDGNARFLFPFVRRGSLSIENGSNPRQKAPTTTIEHFEHTVDTTQTTARHEEITLIRGVYMYGKQRE